MKRCDICYKDISIDENVELLLYNENYKYILGKYKWTHCNYCFHCVNVSRKILWTLYITNLFTTDCKNVLLNLIKTNVPIWITDTMRLDNGTKVKAIFYKGKQYSSRLITGMNDYEINRFQEKIKHIYQNLLQYENMNANMNANINNKINDLQALIANINITQKIES